MTFKNPEVCDPGDDGKWTVKFDHWHTWGCGCKSRLVNKEGGYWEVIYCKEDCELLAIFKGAA